MPKFPDFSKKLSLIKGAVFEKFRSKMVEYGPDLIRLHIGDSYLPPVYPLPVNKNFLEKYNDFSRYGNTFGVEDLREVLVDKLSEDNQLNVVSDNILITTGATNALSATVHSVLEPGEEILVLTPCWPIFPGIVYSANASLIEVPFYIKLYQDPNLNIKELLERYISNRTVAIYLNTPNNPSGKVLNRDQLKQIAECCRKHKLWIISDEAYDGLTFDGHDHYSIATFPDLFKQTITVFTFSKIFLFAGLRLGYVVASEEAIIQLNKILVHQIYSSTIFTQQMMIDPVITRHQWMGDVQKHYQMLRDQFISRSGLPLLKPEATYFIFFSINDFLNGREYDEIIERCFDSGISVAPGIDFGKDFDSYIRICFTGEPPHRLESGADRLRKVLLEI